MRGAVVKGLVLSVCLAVIFMSACVEEVPELLPPQMVEDTNNGPEPPDEDPSDLNNTAAPDTDDRGEPPPPPRLPQPDFDTAPERDCPGGTWVAFISGWLVDEGGFPIEDGRVQTCLRLAGQEFPLCLRPESTNEDGTFAITIPDQGRCVQGATMRALALNQDRATLYCKVDPMEGQQGALFMEEALTLHATERAASLPEQGDPSEARVVTFADGLEMTVTPEHFFGADEGYEALAATRLPAQELCFVPANEELVAVYAFSPEGNVVDAAGFELRIPNVTGLPAGARVPFYVLGGLDCTLADSELVEEGDWVEYGEGIVTDDAEAIVTLEDSALPCLNWFGVGKPR